MIESCPDISFIESHPQWNLAYKTYFKLREEGYETYLAGGCVRDLYLKRKPYDLDIATAATPEQVQKLFSKTVAVGEAFGVVRVVDNAQAIEVATFRQDGPYLDGRRPINVRYSSSREDAERRDFTINALFLDLEKRQIVDYVGGIADLKSKILRTVGDPELRFAEDHLRLLRALRFSLYFGFEIEPQSWKALQEKMPMVTTVSSERIREELYKILTRTAPEKAGHLLVKAGALAALFKSSVFTGQEVERVWAQVYNSTLSTYYRAEPWLFFFWPILISNESWALFENDMTRISPTKREKKCLKVAFDFLRNLQSWKTLGLGEKTVFYNESFQRILLETMAATEVSWKAEVESIKEHFAKVAPKGFLPEPFLRGEDVDFLSGSARGEALRQSYFLQVAEEINSREAALDWLRKKGG